MVEIGDDRLHQLVGEAHHDSVTPDILTEKSANLDSRRLSERPLISYLRSDEQPHFVLHAKKETPDFFGPGSPKEELSRSRGYMVLHLITDQRWIMVAGNRKGDQSHTLPLEQISAIDYSTEGALSHSLAERIFNNKVVLDTGDAFFEIPIANDFDTADLEQLCNYIRETAGASIGDVPLDPDEAGYTIDGYDQYEPDRETVARLLDDLPEELQSEANKIVKESQDSNELVTRLNDLLAEYEEEESLDDVVGDAESTEELREAIKTPVEQRFDEIHEHAETGLKEAKRIFRQAEPEEVGQWALGTGMTARPLARAAPWSTGPLLGASLLLGGTAGVYQSGTEGSILDDIDPLALAGHATAMATQGQELEHIDGEAVGAILGATSYLGETLAPEEYAKWIVEADFDAILEGAELGAARARELQGYSRRQGAMTGAGLGFAYGYATTESRSPEEAMRETLDEEHYKQYLEEMAKRGLLKEDK